MMNHQWSDGEMERTIDICLEHSPGPGRAAAGERLCTAVNRRTPRNQVTSSVMTAALQAAANAIESVADTQPKPPKGLLELIAARRTRGTLQKSW
jgi:hypothetical protein